MSDSQWQADPLVWGQGPRIVEMFLEPTCPFSAKAFAKLEPLLEKAGEDRVTVKIRLQSQPWHLFSGIVTRAILAASTGPGGREAARTVMKAVFARREEFEFEHHCSGPNLASTPRQLIARIEAHSGIAVAEPFLIPDLDREMKWHARYARQNGIHVSPTFMVDGLVQPQMSSGDPVENWIAAIGLV